MNLKPVSLEPLSDPGSAGQDLADLWVRPRMDRMIRRAFVLTGYVLILGGFLLAGRDLVRQVIPLASPESGWLGGSTAESALSAARPEVDTLGEGFGPAVAEAVSETGSQDSPTQSELISQVLGASAAEESEPEASTGTALPSRLHLSSLGVTAPIVSVPIQNRTWNLRSIGNDVAYLEGTGSLGEGNLVLAAHIILWGGGDGPFRRLFTLQPGDQVALYSGDEVFHYRVREHKVVEPTDVSVVMSTPQPTLTLLTCSEWDAELGEYTMRRAVIADLIRTDRTLMQ